MDDSNDRSRQRLHAIELATALGSVTEACRRTGMDRTSFYEWKQRYERDGYAGLIDRPSRPRSHPQTTKDDLAARVITQALAHPGLGCNQLSRLLAGHGETLSSVTIQKILHRAELGTRRDRWLALDVPPSEQKQPLTPEHVAFLEQMNPCWRDRGTSPARPGSVVACGAIPLARHGSKQMYLHFAIDVSTSLVNANVWWDRCASMTTDALYKLLARFEELGADGPPEICTAYGFHGWSRWPIRQLGWQVERLPTTARPKVGAFERFGHIAREEFVPILKRHGVADSRDDLDRTVSDWTKAYNTKRPHDGYPNYGAAPARAFAAGVRKQA